VVDTLRFLVPEAELVDVRAHVGDGSLHSLAVTLAAGCVAAVGVMNRDGGLTEEILEVNGPGVKISVRDMAEVVEHRGGAATVEHRGDWTTVTLQRGFDEICAVFQDAVRRGEVIDAADALRTHEMCERIVAQVGDGVGASR
jgi:virulence factor